MALGSPSPSSSTTMVSQTPSLTTSSAATTTESTNVNSPSEDFFAANGTPALILAFLAIGLFVGGMLAMFGLRRRMAMGGTVGSLRWFTSRPAEHPEEDPWAADLQPATGARKKRNIGKRPNLYDLYADINTFHGGMWKEVMPISANIVRTEVAPSGCEPQALRRSEPRFLSHITSVDPLGIFHRNQPTPGVVSTAPPPSPSRIDIAVAVAMPTPNHTPSDTLDYTLGVARIPWHTALESINSKDISDRSP